MQIVSDFTAISTNDVWTDGFNQLRQVLTFGFAETLPDHHFTVGTAAFRDSYQTLTEGQRDVARRATEIYEEASALAFIEVAPEDADIIFVGSFDFLLSPADANSIGFAFTPSGGQLLSSGDVFVNTDDASSLDLYIHELGHALGLEHAFEGERILSASLDTRANTVMTSAPQTGNQLGPLDIQAIQAMYGTPDLTPEKVIPVVGYADALVSSITFPFLSSLAIGSTSSLSIEVTNFGEEAFGSTTTVIVILSEDNVVDIGDVKLGEVTIGDLAPGQSSPFLPLDFTIPDCVAPGDYNLFTMVDPENLVGEVDELNNIDFLATTTITGVQNPNADQANCPPPFAVDPSMVTMTPPVVTPPVDTTEVIEGTSGADNLTGSAGPQKLIGLGGADVISGLGGGDTLEGGGGRDVLNGNGGKDLLDGGGGKDELNGGGGRDTLLGGGGKDTLDGGGGKDDMQGGGGRDLLLGGRGKDELTGNGGADVFQFTRGNGRDTITDFRQGVDRIEIAEDGFGFDNLQITQLGDDVMIAFANTRIIVETDDAANFTANDFLF